jgi:hypothetical protein
MEWYEVFLDSYHQFKSVENKPTYPEEAKTAVNSTQGFPSNFMNLNIIIVTVDAILRALFDSVEKKEDVSMQTSG